MEPPPETNSPIDRSKIQREIDAIYKETFGTREYSSPEVQNRLQMLFSRLHGEDTSSVRA